MSDDLTDRLLKKAEIDSQITKAIVENNKKLAEITSQIAQASQTLSNRSKDC